MPKKLQTVYKNNHINEEDIIDYPCTYNIQVIFSNQKCTMNLINYLADNSYLDGGYIASFFGILTPWQALCTYQDLPESFILKWKDKVDWKLIALHQHVSKEIIDEYCPQIDLEKKCLL